MQNAASHAHKHLRNFFSACTSKAVIVAVTIATRTLFALLLIEAATLQALWASQGRSLRQRLDQRLEREVLEVQ